MLTHGPMHLLVAVLNSPDDVDSILAGFVELGVRGATVINSEGMGRVLSHDIPIFASLQTLLNRSGPENRTILTVVSNDLIVRWSYFVGQSEGDLKVDSDGLQSPRGPA